MLVAVTIWILSRYRRTVHISRSAADIFWFLSCALRFWFSCHASLEKLASEVEVPLGLIFFIWCMNEERRGINLPSKFYSSLPAGGCCLTINKHTTISNMPLWCVDFLHYSTYGGNNMIRSLT